MAEMKKLRYRQLTPEGFAPYGAYANMLNPSTEKIGAEPIEFYRDMAQSWLGSSTIGSFGVCRVSERPLVIDVSEYHDTCSEAMIPLDGDVLVHVAPAVPQETFPFEKAEVFLVPQGTLFVMRPGVWHHGPFAFGSPVVNVLVTLPERLYMRDCKTYVFDESERIQIDIEGTA